MTGCIYLQFYNGELFTTLNRGEMPASAPKWHRGQYMLKKSREKPRTKEDDD